MNVKFPIPDWWPPAVGDRLRWAAENRTEYMCHVVAVFEHAGKHHVAVAWYGKTKQWWHYEVFGSIDAYFTKIWPDGQERPKCPA